MAVVSGLGMESKKRKKRWLRKKKKDGSAYVVLLFFCKFLAADWPVIPNRRFRSTVCSPPNNYNMT